MITGVHALMYSKDAEKVRAFMRDVLGFRSVDAGDGWLIFELPPAELAAHPVGEGEQEHHVFCLMCDDINRTVAELAAKGVEFNGGIKDRGWGIVITVKVPGGGEVLLYEPRHKTAINII